MTLYAKESDIARMLGHDVDWLRKNAASLEQQFGFPRIDPATGLRHVEAVEEWARERNRRFGTRTVERLRETNRENSNAF